MSTLSRHHITPLNERQKILLSAKFRLRCTLALIVFINLIATFNFAFGQERTSQEYQIKGAFLFNFAQFTEWPASSFPNSQSPLIIGILGDDPFGIFLDQLVKGEKAGGRAILLKRLYKIEEIKTVHILFVARKNEFENSKIFTLANRYSILTVSDADRFTSDGGMVKFFTENNKVRFEVNLHAAREAGIVFSSKVIRLAVICCNTGGSK